MDPIRVPAPDKGAFNKHRKASDLIVAQVKHLKHVEHSLPQEIRDTLPQHPIVTENEAALYIASMTQLLRSRTAPQVAAPTLIRRTPRKAPARPASGLAIAASGESKSKKPSAKKKAPVKSAAKSAKAKSSGARPRGKK